MTFDEYTRLRRAMKLTGRRDHLDLVAFEESQPKECPVCRAQVFDPFGMRVVVHDVDRCRGITL